MTAYTYELMGQALHESPPKKTNTETWAFAPA
eukprot:CAMPEP_0116832628 /NCGR_PEP_ID=MMETSP0418-20121206/5997_1 /TAXON_ID=1158023 /ORGANISM="Astrosyne radiata, Strain 13vi08-1A" /LENGTH=31 /DNA_ID= /DNA_START= /DNA_END= /DNA_ORIENTATION=